MLSPFNPKNIPAYLSRVDPLAGERVVVGSHCDGLPATLGYDSDEIRDLEDAMSEFRLSGFVGVGSVRDWARWGSAFLPEALDTV